MDLAKKRCTPCTGTTPKLSAEKAAELLRSVAGWAIENERLRRTFVFHDFVQAMKFVNGMAELAEAEGHHPDFAVHWNMVDVTIWTHAIGGLSENDFILAAKIDALPR